MAAEVVSCPSCNHPVRVPESLLGESVRCPECKAYFTAPTRDADGRLSEPEIEENAPRQPRFVTVDDDDDRDDARPMISKASIQLPGVFLIIVGSINCLLNGDVLITLLSNPNAAQAVALEGQKALAKILKKELNEEDAKKAANGSAPLILPFVSGAFALSVSSVLGGLAMVTRRIRWLAILGSIMAMINFSNLCCLAGLPIGIWCLIKLADPHAKALFLRPS